MEVILLGIAKGKNICNIAKEGASPQYAVN